MRAWHLREGDCIEELKKVKSGLVDAIVTDPPAGIEFMGKAWDTDKGGRDQWIAWLAGVMRECLRVLKPGGHALVWALPRTSHWTATAVEDAGFEIRDVVVHLNGQGFPKSLDVSKAIDRAAGVEREVTGTQETNVGMQGGNFANATTTGTVLRRDKPVTEDAARWQGWGTALKPGAEHWILARKPLDGTVAANVLAHGTGALNIDGTRIAASADYGRSAANSRGTVNAHQLFEGKASAIAECSGDYASTLGRWPANVTLDEEAAAVLGDASRFFYVAKASRAEKDAGLDHLPVKSGGEATGRKDGAAALASPRTGAGRTGTARNTHPTVKSIALMRWLVRLITPPGGIILDPFAGSGSTGVAALAEGFRFLGIEREREFAEIARARLRSAE